MSEQPDGDRSDEDERRGDEEHVEALADSHRRLLQVPYLTKR